MDARAHPLRRRYGLELALGLGVVLVSLWLLARDGGGARMAGGPGPAPEAPVRAARTDPEREPEPERDSARAEVRGSPPEAASASTALLSVEVVDEHGAPLSGQRVSIRASRLGLPPETFEVHVTGSDGVAAIPVAPLEELRAAAGTAYPRTLHASLEPDFEGAPLVALPETLAGARARLVVPEEDLRHLRPLRVRVEDAQGAPVGGVEVQLLARKLDERDFGPPKAAGTSRAEDGLAELDLTAFRSERGLGARGWRHRLQAWAPFAALPSLELGAELPAEAVVLRLPPSGAIAVKVNGAERAPAEACVELLSPALVGQAQLASLRAPIVDGQALFPAVGLGLALQLRVRAPGCRPLPPLELRGPSVACERVSATLELGAEWPRATLIAVDEHGDPLANQLFHGWIDGPMPPPPLEPSPRSDAHGRLVFHVPGEPLPGEVRRLCLRPADRGPFPPAMLALPAALEPGVVTELGTLVFPAPAWPERPARVTLASGHVVDEDGRPIGLASVLLHATSGYSRPASSAADGSFRIDGLPEHDAPVDGTLELIARCPGFLEARVPGLRPGAADLRIALARAAGFEARVLVDDDLPMTRMYGRLERVGGEVPLALAEHIVAGEVPPGVYTFSVLASSSRRCLARVEGLRLLPGPSPVDPRLAPLDLRGRVVGVTARLETSERSTLSGTVSVRIEGGGEVLEEVWLIDDEGRLHGVALRGQELVIAPAGFAPQSLVADGLEPLLSFTPEAAR